MADVINVWAIFTNMVLLPTLAAGSFGKRLVLLPLSCVLGIICRSSRWVGLALWLFNLVNSVRCLPIDCLLSHPCIFFSFLSTEQMYLVLKASSSGSLVDLKPRHCIMPLPAGKLLNSFSWSLLEIRLKFVPFLHYKSRWVELLSRELLIVIHL